MPAMEIIQRKKRKNQAIFFKEKNCLVLLRRKTVREGGFFHARLVSASESWPLNVFIMSRTIFFISGRNA